MVVQPPDLHAFAEEDHKDPGREVKLREIKLDAPVLAHPPKIAVHNWIMLVRIQSGVRSRLLLKVH